MHYLSSRNGCGVIALDAHLCKRTGSIVDVLWLSFVIIWAVQIRKHFLPPPKSKQLILYGERGVLLLRWIMPESRRYFQIFLLCILSKCPLRCQGWVRQRFSIWSIFFPSYENSSFAKSMRFDRANKTTVNNIYWSGLPPFLFTYIFREKC